MTRGQEDIAINFSQDEKKRLNLGVVDQNQLKVIHAKIRKIFLARGLLRKNTD